MDSRLKPFKSFEANGNYYVSAVHSVSGVNAPKGEMEVEVQQGLMVQVRDLDYSPDGQNLLIISGTNQAKVFNREGEAETAYVMRRSSHNKAMADSLERNLCEETST